MTEQENVDADWSAWEQALASDGPLTPGHDEAASSP